MSRVAFVLIGLYLPFFAAATVLQTDRSYYEAGEVVRITFVPDTDDWHEVWIYGQRNLKGSFEARWNFEAHSGSAGKPFEFRWKPQLNSPRRYFDIYAVRHTGQQPVRLMNSLVRIFIQRTSTALDDRLIDWSFEENAVVGPEHAITVAVDPDYRTPEGAKVLVQLIQLGRHFPGGSVAVDQVVSESTQALNYTQGFWTSVSAPLPRRGLIIQPADQAPPTYEDILSVNDNTLPDLSWDVFPRHGDLARVGTLKSINQVIEVGFYAVRIIGDSGIVLASRNFEVRYPELSAGLLLDPEGVDLFTSFPAMMVTPDRSTDFELVVNRIGRDGVLQGSGRLLAVIPRSEESGLVQRIKPVPYLDTSGAWPPGRYRISLKERGFHTPIEVGRREFELDQPAEPNANWFVDLEPPIDLEDISITPTSTQTTVFGAPITFSVTSKGVDYPPDTGPLVAELYFMGHYTYDCRWRMGYYTGTRGLVDRSGHGQLAAPGEAGLYQIRLFRPRETFPYSGARRGRILPPAAAPGSQDALESVQLVGVEHIEVTAPERPELIELTGRSFAPGSEVQFTVIDPGPDLAHHQFELQAWQAASSVPGGLRTVARVVNDPRTEEFRISDSAPRTRLRIDRFPFSGATKPIDHPGNYELRLYDLSTGLYVSRAEIRVRDPGPPAMPASAQFVELSEDDWPAHDDPLRGLQSWRPPASQCADPEFPSPPDILVVNLWPNDPDTDADDEYRVAESIWPGHPYLIQAEFRELPPDDVYQVRVNGVRRIAVYRSRDDAKVYRSRVVSFNPESDNLQ